MFFILAESHDSGETWTDNFDSRFQTGDKAQETARIRNERFRDLHKNYPDCDYDKVRYRVRCIRDTDNENYFVREKALGHEFIDVKGMWPGAWLPEYHMPHWHPDDPKMIRFFRSINDAVAQRYTQQTATRYLYQRDLELEDYEQYLIDHGYYKGETEFKILTDKDDIVRAYENGPSSCMADPDEYELPDPHPVHVYAAGDLAIAVIERGGDVTARALVWPDRKIYASIYGHEKLLTTELDKLGYRRTFAQSAWRGARLLKVVDGDEFVCPYIDVSETVSVGRDGFLRLAATRGSRGCKETNGYTYKSDW